MMMSVFRRSVSQYLRVILLAGVSDTRSRTLATSTESRQLLLQLSQCYKEQ